jgi:hypothetical protein
MFLSQLLCCSYKRSVDFTLTQRHKTIKSPNSSTVVVPVKRFITAVLGAIIASQQSKEKLREKKRMGSCTVAKLDTRCESAESKINLLFVPERVYITTGSAPSAYAKRLFINGLKQFWELFTENTKRVGQCVLIIASA